MTTCSSNPWRITHDGCIKERKLPRRASLCQFGLRPKVIPFNEPEYKELVDRFIDQPQFRSLVREIAEGLGLSVLDVNNRGLFLGTVTDSAFAMKPSNFRAGRTSSSDDRLLDGLIQIAIAATIYPRQQDLDERTIEAKLPISCQEVDEVLRRLCLEYKQRQTEDPDAVASGTRSGGCRKPGGSTKVGRPLERQIKAASP